MRLYIACPLADVVSARAVAASLAVEHDIVSRWHSIIRDGARDPVYHDERADLLRTNLADMYRADAVVAITPSAAGKATYCEIGFALALGKSVVLASHDEARCIFDAHPLVRRVPLDRYYVDSILRELVADGRAA